MADDYSRVADALAAGADPDMLCMTCPWDRMCVKPPAMSSDEVKQRIEEAQAEDLARQQAAPERGMPVGMLMAAMVFSGRDQRGEMCPVFALRLRGSGGRGISDSLKSLMQAGS